MSSPDRLLLELRGAARAPVELPRAGVLVLGTDSARAGFVLAASDVEGAHCAIARAKGGGWAVRDLGSRTGTLLNGKRIESARLAAGDVLQIGSSELLIVDPLVPRGTRAPAVREESLSPVELETPVAALGEAPPASPSEIARTPGPTIQGYALERSLGRGGMGQVYLAVQISLARQVALKVLAPRLASDAEFVRRFQAEARAAAALGHPNVVTVYDVGEDRGTHYLSMEYMDRGNLEERVTRSGPLPWREALEILRDAAQGLSFAEARGIVHRDLKPANLMQNSVGQTKIADLGLATHVEAEEAQAADRKVFGTPHFMSPEQARGEKVDSRSDLYSLGATAYRLLSAHTPFEGANAQEIVRAHLREDPRPLRDFAPELPEGVVAMVTRLMQKDPAARYASASELVRELERLRAQGDSGSGMPDLVRTRARKSGSGQRVLALLVLAAAGGGGWYWYQSQLPPSPPPTPPWAGPGNGAPVAPAAPVQPGDAPQAVSGTQPEPPAGAGGEPGGDQDQAEQMAEASARGQLQELLEKELPARERRDELRLLAARMRGTTAASEALQKADEIAAELAQEEVVRTQQGAALDEILTRLRQAADLDRTPPLPGQALLKLRAVDGQQAFTEDPVYQAARKQIEREILQNATRYVDGVLAVCDELQAKGEFDKLREKLAALTPVFDLPDFPPGEGPAGVADFMTIGRSARERLRTLDLTRVTFTTEKRREDIKLIAVSFGGHEGLERELHALELAAAFERLTTTAERMSQPESKQYLQELAAEVGRARAALEMIAREFPNWRRKAIVDPRDKKGITRNAVGAEPGGILCEGEGGKVERVDWSAFGGNARDLARLFTERLTREYTPEELRGISALLRIGAVLEAIDVSSKMFDPEKRANFTESNARELLEAYTPAVQWAQKAGDAAATARELSAATLLVQVLQRVTEGAWSVAVVGTEQLLADAQDSLLVRLLSDGNVLAGAPAGEGAATPRAPQPAPGGTPPGGDGTVKPRDGRR